MTISDKVTNECHIKIGMILSYLPRTTTFKEYKQLHSSALQRLGTVSNYHDKPIMTPFPFFTYALSVNHLCGKQDTNVDPVALSILVLIN